MRHLCPQHKDPFSPSRCYVILSLLAPAAQTRLRPRVLPSVAVHAWLSLRLGQTPGFQTISSHSAAQGGVQAAAARWALRLPVTVRSGCSASILWGTSSTGRRAWLRVREQQGGHTVRRTPLPRARAAQQHPGRKHRASSSPPGRRQGSFGRAEGKRRWCQSSPGCNHSISEGSRLGAGKSHQTLRGRPSRTGPETFKLQLFHTLRAEPLSRSEVGTQPAGTACRPRGQERSHSSPLGPRRLPASRVAICKRAANCERPQHRSARRRGCLTAVLTHAITLASVPTEPGKCVHPPSSRGAARPGHSRHQKPAWGPCLHQTPSDTPRAAQRRRGAQAGSGHRSSRDTPAASNETRQKPALQKPSFSTAWSAPRFLAALLFLRPMRSFMGKTPRSSSRVSPFPFA